LKFNDGEFPNRKIIKKFLTIISDVYSKKNILKESKTNMYEKQTIITNSKKDEYKLIKKENNQIYSNENNLKNNNILINNEENLNSDKNIQELKQDEEPCIAVHCIAGLGR